MKTKYIKGLFLIALSTATAFGSIAQEKKRTVGQTIDRTATKVGNKTAEVAVKGSAKVADKTWKGMMAPDGTNVYIDGSNKKYYVNKKGARVYLKASQIKPRPKS
jgi:lipid-binding SYLF domain-containing protein